MSWKLLRDYLIAVMSHFWVFGLSAISVVLYVAAVAFDVAQPSRKFLLLAGVVTLFACQFLAYRDLWTRLRLIHPRSPAEGFAQLMQRFRLSWLTEAQAERPDFQAMRQAARTLQDHVTQLGGGIDENKAHGPELVSRMRAILGMCKKIGEFTRYFGDGDEFVEIVEVGNNITIELQHIVRLLAENADT